MKVVKEKNRLALLVPEWNVQNNVRAFTTMRQGLNTENSYGNFNLATHVGDDLKHVMQNRADLLQAIALPAEPVWLEQTHSIEAINLDEFEPSLNPPKADAAFTTQKNQVCAILTADCLPIIVCDQSGKGVLAIHAGWRGLVKGIISIAIEKFTNALNIEASECCVWMGPAISQRHFEVGSEVYLSFIENSQAAKKAFLPKENGKYFCDLYHLARLELESINITQISGGEYCTYAQENEFYSYRRHTHQLKQIAQNNARTDLPSFLRADDTKIKSFTKDCGRQATLIWLSDNN